MCGCRARAMKRLPLAMISKSQAPAAWLPSPPADTSRQARARPILRVMEAFIFGYKASTQLVGEYLTEISHSWSSPSHPYAQLRHTTHTKNRIRLHNLSSTHF